jgi:hypothetical protein
MINTVYILVNIIKSYRSVNKMTDRRRTSETQMADLNVQLDSQTEQIKNMRKVAQENNNITNDIQG